MKKVKGMILFLLTVCVLAVMPMAMKMDVNAESVTYSVGFDDSDYKFQIGYPWDEDAQHRELYYLEQDIKDGDKIVIYPSASGVKLNLNARLADVTVNQATDVVVTAKGYDAVYFLTGSTGAANGTVSKGVAYGGTKVNFNGSVGTGIVYEESSLNFQGNVERLEIYGEDQPKANVEVAGTVNTLVVQGGSHVDYLIQNIHEGKMKMEDGHLRTSSKYFNARFDGSEAETMSEFTKNQAAAAPATPAAPAAGNGNTSNDYDAVPKTGDTTNAFAWLMAAVAFAVVAVYARKRSTI